jgi:hypothetical protein
MAVDYEVWDRETFNRVGTFPTEAEAEAYLGDVLRVNGAAVAAEMAIITYPEPGGEPVMIRDGADFVASCQVPPLP